MILGSKLEIAQVKGESIVKEFRQKSLPVDLLAIAEENNILVQEKPDGCGAGVSGMLLRYGNSFGIMYSKHIKNEGFQRFSIAHELGHYFLAGHLDHVFSGNKDFHNSYAGFKSNDSYELEADHFASGLLMPSHLIQSIIQNTSHGFSVVEKIANLCKTSLVSSAIRYAKISKDAVVIIVSMENKVDFCFVSKAMKYLLDTSWPTKKSPIPKNSITAEFYNNPDNITQAEYMEDEIDIREWLGGDQSIQFKEEVKGIGTYGKTLTVLSCSEDIEEICSEERTVENWEPHF